jgi:uncharacterized protein YdcH (DUF465 family)
VHCGWGQEFPVDSTDSLQPRFVGEAHLARLFEEHDEENDDDTGGESGSTHLPVALTDLRSARRSRWIDRKLRQSLHPRRSSR